MLHIETINLKKVHQRIRKELALQCFNEIFQKIWEGVSFEDFYRMFFSPADLEKVFLFKTPDQNLAGYFIYRAIEMDIKQKKYGIARLSTNILPQYFGQNLLHRIVFIESMKYFLKSLLSRRSFMIFFTANSPASYCVMKRRSRKVFPCPKLGVPEAYRELMRETCQRFQVPLIDEENFVSHYPVTLRSSVAKHMEKSTQEDEIYRFYMERCPRYQEGQALVIMKPVSAFDGFIDICQQIFRLGRIQVTKQIHAIRLIFSKATK